MQVVVTAVGPDHVGLADPLIHHVTGQGANIAEIQMYDHDEQALFAMLLRIEWPADELETLRTDLCAIGALKNLSVRVWSSEERVKRPRLAICTTYRQEPARELLQAIADGRVSAEPVLMVGNRPSCQSVAADFDVPWEMLGDAEGRVDEDRMVELFDRHEVDYVVLARYMRVLSAATCWKFAGGRIVNLHHGLLPSFPGLRPYHDAYASRMLTYGATCHYIVPELDAGNQIIYQSTFTVPPGMRLPEIIRLGEQENEPQCLVEGIRRVIDREVQLHFHRVVARR
ncbi:MAG TPA: formyltetrahydrofolate deformylase [Planctomycetaceae bacterium]|jgi:formyltetrahydrofolate deformylase|nr:formyltetrahydrofolate deformylase [Planctomycetaceae bacterium]